ncbi:hypothetical protein [Hymenobacter algoricola]|uniref:T9SS type A sorting domain-containing protein n=1 Tax=Hymenobacter algoricola TaxID=486267 RepID=A0ABP7MVB4_9BACT
MKHFLFFSLCWLAALSGPPATAQLRVQKIFGSTGNEAGGFLTPVRAGGYLVVGGQQKLPPLPINQKLYLVRTNAQGDTLWTRTQKLPGFTQLTVRAVCENTAGQVLVATDGGDPATARYAAMLVLLNPQGDTLWTRKVSGPTNDIYTSLLLGNDGNFVLTALLNTFPQWLKVNAAGQVVARTDIIYDASRIGFVSGLFKDNSGRGGYWLQNTSGGSPNERKALHLTEAGVVDQTKPLYGTANNSIRSVAPLPNQSGYLICENAKLTRYNAALDTVWTKYIHYTNGFVADIAVPELLQPLADGNVVMAGRFYYANGYRVYLGKVTPDGRVLRDTVLFRGSGSEFVRGLAVQPGTSNYVFSGEAQQGPIGGSDLFLGIHANWTVLSTRPGQVARAAFQAWPNPVSAARPELTLRSDQPLTGELRLCDMLGRTVRTWPVAPALAQPAGQRLALPGLPPGLYLLNGSGADGRRYSARIVCE